MLFNKKSNLELLEVELKDMYDLKVRRLPNKKGDINLIYIDSIIDSSFLSEFIIEPLTKDLEAGKALTKKEMEKTLSANILSEVQDVNDAIFLILTGNILICLADNNTMLYCEARNYSGRSVEIPPTENVVKGPREGFVENIIDNISLLRKRIKSPKLKLENYYVGKESKTLLVIAYLKGSVPQELLEYVRQKITEAKLDFVIASSYIEEIFQNKGTFFDTVGYTEKPDIASSKLLEGKIVIIVEGTPNVITLPYFFLENFQNADDYYQNIYFANFIRFLRMGSLIITVFLPGLYLALVTYHFRLIPSLFIFRLAVSRAGVPIPTVVEITIMLIFFQLIREAGVRLPQPIGQSLSIVGALILGETAVGASLASETTVIVVGLSSITSFLVPKLYGAVTAWSFIVLIFSGVLGLPGFYTSFILFVSHVAGLKTCTYPYLFPLATYNSYKYGDVLYRAKLKNISRDIFAPGERNE